MSMSISYHDADCANNRNRDSPKLDAFKRCSSSYDGGSRLQRLVLPTKHHLDKLLAAFNRAWATWTRAAGANASLTLTQRKVSTGDQLQDGALKTRWQMVVRPFDSCSHVGCEEMENISVVGLDSPSTNNFDRGNS